MPFKARKSVFEELEKIADISALSKEDQEKYEHIIKVYRDNLVTEQWAIEQGFKKGHEKGHEKGLQEGIQIGQEKGTQTERLKNARGMKTAGITPELIAQITGLSTEEIQKL